MRLPDSLSARFVAAAKAAGLTELLQDFCGVLHAEGCLAGLSWPDAKTVAAAILVDFCNRDDPAGFLRYRARLIREGRDGQTWDDREAVLRALDTAAAVLGR